MVVEEEDLDGRRFHQHDMSPEEVDNDGVHNEGLMLQVEVSDIGVEDKTIENYCSDNENISSKDNDSDAN